MSENSEPLLSSEELSAIEQMLDGGEFEQETFKVNPNAQPYSLARNEESLGPGYGALTQINERFHRFFRTRMLTELDYNPRLSTATPQLVKYSEYIQNVASPSSINVVELAPLKGEALIVIHPQVIFSCLDNWYGGQARSLWVGDERGFTANENAIIDKLCGLMFDSTSEAWAPYVDISVDLVNRDINPLFANIAGDEESVVVNRFSVGLRDEKTEPYIDIVYTYRSLNLQRDLLSTRIQGQDADEKWRDRLQTAIGEVDFSLLVSGGSIDLTVGQLLNLSVGEVLSFSPQEEVEVRVNDFPLYNAVVGQAGSKIAVQVQESVFEESIDE